MSALWRAFRGWFTGRNFTDEELCFALRQDHNHLIRLSGTIREADRARLRYLKAEQDKQTEETLIAAAEILEKRQRAMG